MAVFFENFSLLHFERISTLQFFIFFPPLSMNKEFQRKKKVGLFFVVTKKRNKISGREKKKEEREKRSSGRIFSWKRCFLSKKRNERWRGGKYGKFSLFAGLSFLRKFFILRRNFTWKIHLPHIYFFFESNLFLWKRNKTMQFFLDFFLSKKFSLLQFERISDSVLWFGRT